MSGETPSLSTSALAKALQKTSKQMFSELEALGWIERIDDAWKLTAKGEFEGGTYRESKRFGRYIIWPEELVEHQALVNQESYLCTVAQLARELALPTMMLAALIHNLGWQRRGRKGWLVTSKGSALGGGQRLDVNGIPSVVWPMSLVENSQLINVIHALKAEPIEGAYPCLDGHQVNSRAEQQIDNWLYLSGFVHAYRHALPFTDDLHADFYLPDSQLYIEYWGEGNQPQIISDKMRKKTLLTDHDCKLIELAEDDLEKLEERLPRLLLSFDVEM